MKVNGSQSAMTTLPKRKHKSCVGDSVSRIQGSNT